LDNREHGGDARVQFRLADPSRVAEIADVPGVVWVDRVAAIRATSAADASIAQSGSPTKSPVWDRGLHGEGQVIGLIDEGPIDLEHCFFSDSPKPPGPGHRKVRAHRDLTLPDGSAAPVADHATFVAGIAAGDERGNSGKHPDRGGAWAAKLVIGTFDGVVANGLLKELGKAAATDAVIHSNSWNEGKTPRGAYTQRAHDVDTFTWLNEDHLVLGGTGNSFDQTTGNQLVPGNLSPPGIAKNAICVSAAKAAPDQRSMGDGTFGPTADKRRKPDLVVVGCGTRSAQKSATPSCNTVPIPCGTSMAVPNAAAAAALVRQYFVEGWYPTGDPKTGRAMTPTGALLKAVLLNATVDMTGEPGYPGDFEGWGLVTLDRTLHFAGSARSLVVWDVRMQAGVAARETGTHSLKVGRRDEQLKITLAFTDHPPDPTAFATPAVNDLDLTVTAPDRTVYRGNDLTASGVSAPNGTKADPRNTVEMVIVDNPQRGTWTIDVHATSITTFTRQGYAVVASGGALTPLVKAVTP
jgi:hypothetical protein